MHVEHYCKHQADNKVIALTVLSLLILSAVTWLAPMVVDLLMPSAISILLLFAIVGRPVLAIDDKPGALSRQRADHSTRMGS